MKVAFVYIDPSYSIMAPFHVGVASLIAYLRKAGHQCAFFYLMGDVGEQEYVDFLIREKPDVVGFSIMTNTFPHLAPLARLTKRHLPAFTICGGIHASLSPEEVISVEGIDAVCVGEGEEALCELCNNLASGKDISGIANLWVRQDGRVQRNPLRPLMAGLDALPFMDREVSHYRDSFDLAFMKRGVFMASRGCPYNCSYCCNHAMKSLYGGNKYIRFRSVDHLLEEVETVVRDFPQIEYNVFHDDLLPLKKEWFYDFTEGYRKRIGLPFEMNCHPNLMDREVARMAKEAGCSLMRFGLESGNEQLRRGVLDRHTSNQRIVDAFARCEEVGIQTLSYNMIGLPFETRPQILDTIKLNARVKPVVAHVSIFYPYRGTKAYDICQREGFLTDKQIDTYYEDSVLEQKGVTPQQLRFLRRYFARLIGLYSRCYALPRTLGKFAEKLLDLAILAATSNWVLRALNWRRKGERAVAGPCYTIDGSEVRVWDGE